MKKLVRIRSRSKRRRRGMVRLPSSITSPIDIRTNYLLYYSHNEFFFVWYIFYRGFDEVNPSIPSKTIE
jgi:hypothetical protein